MSKKASGFGLKDYEARNNTFVVENNAKEKSDEETILLDIIGEDAVPLAEAKRKQIQKKISKTKKIDLYKAYQKMHATFSFKRRVPLKEKAIFYELTATMLDAGIPLIQAVKVFTEQTTHKYFRKVSQAITYQIEKGQSLSQAMREYKHIFTEAEAGMIEAAEATGRLASVMLRQSEEIEASIELRAKIRSAMIYPVIVFAFVILTLYGMLRYVIPQMSALFESTGLELPALTSFLISASDFVVENGVLVVAGFVVLMIALWMFGVTPLGKYVYHSLILKLPVLGVFQKAINQSRFARSLSNLLGAGVSVVTAVEITSRAVTNEIYKRKINLIAKDVSQGIPIAESIQDSKYFSNLMVSMISVGERTAQIDELTKKTAEYYESKVGYMADNFAKLIQPFIILIVGSMVGVVVLSIMLPMTKLIGGIEAL
jgi:type IV pilus assembly protein PilC